MSEPFQAWGEDDTDGQAQREPAVEFAWDEVDSASIGFSGDDAIARARVEGGQAMLSALLSVCAEGLTRIDRKDRRASKIGVRLLCAAAVMRPGQVSSARVRDIAALLGMHHRPVFAVIQKMREALNRIDRSGT